MEAVRLVRALADRMVESPFYQISEVYEDPGSMLGLCVKTPRTKVVIYITETPLTALSFVMKSDASDFKHMNRWSARDRSYQDMDRMIDDMWDAFWLHELENRDRGWPQWMHGPKLETKAESFMDFLDSL